MAVALSPSEEAQLQQTIEMFEVITQSQPQDYQSLEILKEAYLKLGREPDAVNTSKRIAEAYVHLGQLSSAILEYETILQRCPDDQDVAKALAQIESTANTLAVDQSTADAEVEDRNVDQPAARKTASGGTTHLDDGSTQMRKLFVEGKHISQSEFELCWPAPDSVTGKNIMAPFIQELQEKNMMNVEKSLKLLADKARLGYLPLELYDINIELARSYSAAVCRRWCILPFDRVGKAVLVATTNPFNARAVKELQDLQPGRIQWYLAAPAELSRQIKKVFRS
ncbi:tetratricopeptide repeat protein [bacterium]|nr:tetratricopeptide repeat protein [bacterium]